MGLSALFDLLMRGLGPCLVVMAVALIGAVTFLYFGFLLPLLGTTEHGDSPLLRSLHGAWAAFLLFNVLFNYAACVLTPPGGLHQHEGTNGVYEYEEGGVMYALGAGGGGSSNVDASGVDPRTYGFCKKCKVPRPPRAHHCHVCRRCVLKMVRM